VGMVVVVLVRDRGEEKVGDTSARRQVGGDGPREGKRGDIE